MAYDEILSTELDAESPITDTVMGKVIANFNFLKDRTDAIPPLGFTGGDVSLGTDTNHDVSIAAVTMLDTTGAQSLSTSAAQIKQLDSRWASGSLAGGLANAALVSASTAVSFDNATSKINGTGLFGDANAGATVIVSGSSSNDGNFEVTAADANSLTVSPAPTTEGAGASITIYIIQPRWVYHLFAGLASGGDTEFGYDDSATATNFLSEITGTYYRKVAEVVTDSAANIWKVFWSLPTDVQVFTRSGTYNKPPQTSRLDVYAIGGGASGGRSNSGTESGGGGGGGACAYGKIPGHLVGDTESITIGAGGAAITSGQADGQPGGDTSFGSLLTGYAGGGGNDKNFGGASGGGGGGGGAFSRGGTGTSDQNGEAGGDPGGGVGGVSGGTGVPSGSAYGGGGGSAGEASAGGGDSYYGGGGGAGGDISNSNPGGDSYYGGGGGGGGRTDTTAAGAGGLCLSGFAGNGGAGGNGNTAGTDGEWPGGGGGGAESFGASGAGADGLLVVYSR